MITTHLHYPQGTYTAIETPTGYVTDGYIPSRKDKLINAHIVTQDGYELYLDTYSLTLRYKYITLAYNSLRIGRWHYPVTYIHTCTSSEKNYLRRLDALRLEAIQHGTVDGYELHYRIAALVQSMEIQ